MATINNSKIPITAVGEDEDAALLCFTDLFQLLDYSRVNDSFNNIGTWYFPNSSAVGTRGEMYITRDQGVVRLHRRDDVTMPTGQFYCEILDGNRNNQSIFVEITYYDSIMDLMMTSYPSSPNKAVVAEEAVVAGASVSGLILISAGFVLVILVTIRYTYLHT